MNIFYLSKDPYECAAMHCDKHVVKMIVEYAQLLSTAHRLLDGKEYTAIQNGRRLKRWRIDPYHEYDNREDVLYKASHVNHPSNIWARANNNNYTWLYSLWICLMKEYTYRYNNHHACEKLIAPLEDLPYNIPIEAFMDPPLAMPDEYKMKSSVDSYRNFYLKSKSRFARWTERDLPMWYSDGLLDLSIG